MEKRRTYIVCTWENDRQDQENIDFDIELKWKTECH